MRRFACLAVLVGLGCACGSAPSGQPPPPSQVADVDVYKELVIVDSSVVLDARASNATLPLDRSVRTLLKPASSKLRLSSGILQFIGLTPRRKAT